MRTSICQTPRLTWSTVWKEISVSNRSANPEISKSTVCVNCFDIISIACIQSLFRDINTEKSTVWIKSSDWVDSATTNHFTDVSCDVCTNAETNNRSSSEVNENIFVQKVQIRSDEVCNDWNSTSGLNVTQRPWTTPVNKNHIKIVKIQKFSSNVDRCIWSVVFKPSVD